MFEHRLHELYSQDLLPREYVNYMMNLDIHPTVIYDIGSCVLHWTRWAHTKWPAAKIYLFEAMDEVKFLYDDLNYQYHLGVLSDTEKEVEFFQNTFHPGGNSYYRENPDINPVAQILFSDAFKIKKVARPLQDVVYEKQFPLPHLIKLDVQGSELDILKGAGDALSECTDIFIEMQKVQYNKGAPMVEETTKWLNENGFQLVKQFSNSRPEAPDSDYHFKRRE